MNRNPKRHKIGDRVTVIEAITDGSQALPPQPWEGTVIAVTSKVIKCRPATVYHVETSSGEVLRAWYRHIRK